MGDPAETARDLPMEIHPVGVVHTAGDMARVAVLPQYADALHGIDEAASVQILYWMHRLEPGDRTRLQVHPRGDRTRPLRGVFALRSPMRPNPIGSSVVELVRREGLDLIVRGLDARDGSPIIDIKQGHAR